VGRKLQYSTTHAGRKHRYWLTVFVSAGEVVVVEAAGDEAFFDKDTEKKVEAAIASVTLS
jgi:hypothetical protein